MWSRPRRVHVLWLLSGGANALRAATTTADDDADFGVLSPLSAPGGFGAPRPSKTDPARWTPGGVRG
eukprot:3170664-Pyramimonas_sp.AAC.1